MKQEDFMNYPDERQICAIVSDAKDGIIPSHEECYWTMLALSGMLYHRNRRMESIEECAEKHIDDVPLSIYLNAKGVRKESFNWMKSNPKHWLGAMGNPFSEENKKMKRIGRNIIKKATGIDV